MLPSHHMEWVRNHRYVQDTPRRAPEAICRLIATIASYLVHYRPRHNYDTGTNLWYGSTTTQAPWIPPGLQDGDARHTVPRYMTAREPVPRPHGPFSSYREPPRSDPGSYHTGRHLSDSGYGTRTCFAVSVPSAEYEERSQGNPSVADDLGGMDLQMEEMQELRNNNSQDTALIGIKDLESIAPQSSHPPSLVCAHENCGTVCRNQSDLKLVAPRAMMASPTDVRAESTANATPNHTSAMCLAALGGEASARGTTWTGTRRACTTSSLPTAPIVASDAEATTAPKGTSSGLAWTTSALTASACTRPRTSKSSSNSQQFDRPHGHSRDADADDYARSEVEPAKISGPDHGRGGMSNRSVLHRPRSHPTDAAKTVPMKSPSTSRFLPQASGWGRRVSSDQSAASSSPAAHQDACYPLDLDGKRGDVLQTIHEQQGLDKPDQDSVPPDLLQPAHAAGTPRSESKAEELSRAIACDLSSMMKLNQATPRDLQSAIYAKLMSHLDLASSAKRTSVDASLDEAGPPRAKRVICRSCSKTMERPCDLK